ncbi:MULTISPECIES: helix-turn-helix domain-containing protein [Enterococcus]|uniref:helix-turn-helix domain-containing protein n=1 Tax=Enterococcus TaxID=1350 RepID=UPI001105B1D3|nr:MULTISPECIES: helix-turn-helix domain-containing protein [Enterococcus]MDB1679532.1 helix-turn-helix domain-containing protein [Enterococcus durans]
MQILSFEPVRRNHTVQKEELRRAIEISRYFRVSPATVTRWTQRKENPLPSKKKGNVVLIDLNVAKKWFEEV